MDAVTLSVLTAVAGCAAIIGTRIRDRRARIEHARQIAKMSHPSSRLRALTEAEALVLAEVERELAALRLSGDLGSESYQRQMGRVALAASR